MPNLNNVLRACRQIYAESAVLLYQLNTFYFDWPVAMDVWMEYRRPGQNKAVQHIKIDHKIARDRCNGDYELSGPLTIMFPALKTMTISNTLMTYGYDK